MSTSLPPSIPDTQLGLSASEIHLLRQHQQLALTPHHPHYPNPSSPSYAHSTTSTRGRGHARTSASTSRGTSAASSQQAHHPQQGAGAAGGGRLVLDAGSLAVLGQHFERVMGAIQNRVESLSTQTTHSTTSHAQRASTALQVADAEIARFRDILRQIDELEVEFDKVRHIRDIVKGFRVRVEALGARVDGKRR